MKIAVVVVAAHNTRATLPWTPGSNPSRADNRVEAKVVSVHSRAIPYSTRYDRLQTPPRYRWVPELDHRLTNDCRTTESRGACQEE